MALIFLKIKVILGLPSDFTAIDIGLDQGLIYGYITPGSIIFFKSVFADSYMKTFIVKRNISI